MTQPSAAIPGRRVEAGTEFRAQPAEETIAGCPMCKKADQLVLDIPASVHYRIKAYWVGATACEFELGEQFGDTEEPKVEPSGIRCLYCRWAYRGANPLARLLPLT